MRSVVEADIRSQARYRLGMTEKARANNADAMSRVAGSGEHAIRAFAALPLRMFAGTLSVFEAVVRTAADTLREIDPIDERVMDLERRVDSLEEQTTGRESSRATSATRKSAATAVAAEPEQSGPQ
jgi:hypothetical protein